MSIHNIVRFRRIGWLVVLGLWVALRFYWPFPQMPWWLTMVALYGLLIAGALLVIGVKVAHVFDAEDAIYADKTGGWHWRRWSAIIPVVGAMWAVSIGLSAALGAVGMHLPSVTFLWMLVLAQILLVGLGEELFFREAAMRVAAGHVGWLLTLSVLAFGLIHWQAGGSAIMIAMGAGSIYLAARLIGVPILVVAVAHGLTNVVFRYVIWSAPDAPELYAILFMMGCFLVAFVMLRTIGVYQRPRIGQG
jgi:hypothetical protein